MASGRLLFKRHRSWMTGSWPRREQQQESGVGAGMDCMALIRSEFDQQAAAAADALAGRICDLHLAVEHGDPGTFI